MDKNKDGRVSFAEVSNQCETATQVLDDEKQQISVIPVLENNAETCVTTYLKQKHYILNIINLTHSVTEPFSLL